MSVGSGYGILTLVFQDGHGEKALAFTSVGGTPPGCRCSCSSSSSASRWTTACSSLSRVRELVDRGMSTDKPVAEGIKGTAGVIASAAAVMVVTFAAFAIGDSQDRSSSASAWPSPSSSTPRSSARSCCPRW